jgi:hypothetical protein
MRSRFERLGIRLDTGFSVFEVEESDPLWNRLQELLRERKDYGFVITKFTKEELERAELLTLEPSWHWSYPQPEKDFAYVNITYDTADYCPKCGMGKKQKAPFRVLRQPGWSNKRNILQLNWVFDEYFVTKKAYNELFEPLGIGKWEVIKHRDRSVLDDMVQLRVDTIARAPLNLDVVPSEVCDQCKRRKFEPVMRGPFPSFNGYPGEAIIMKSQEYFGSGGDGGQEIIISRELYSKMVEYGIKGVDYRPVG